MPRKPLALLIVVAALVLGLMLFPAFARVLTEWWWFKEIGYQVVALFLGGAFVTTLVLWINFRIAQRGIVPHPMVFRVAAVVPGPRRSGVS